MYLTPPVDTQNMLSTRAVGYLSWIWYSTLNIKYRGAEAARDRLLPIQRCTQRAHLGSQNGKNDRRCIFPARGSLRSMPRLLFLGNISSAGCMTVSSHLRHFVFKLAVSINCIIVRGRSTADGNGDVLMYELACRHEIDQWR